ncbi:MAG: hypothetical protein PHI29_13255 [Gallionella sp.]|nr:hypothetical protein [Gallionella sp.]
MPEEKTKLEPCGCCSKLVEVAEDVNREDVYCTDCMGDPKAKSTKDRLGWAGRQFFEARFPIVRNALSKEAHKQKWDKMTYEKKVAFIGKMIEQGAMI